MVFGALFSQTKSFEDAFHSPSVGYVLAVVIINAIILGAAAHQFSNNMLAGVFVLAVALVQWAVFAVLVWFFELIHVKRRRSAGDTHFVQSAGAVAKLWSINLASSVIAGVLVLLRFVLSESALYVVLIIAAILFVVLLIGWLVGSYKLIRIVTGASGAKLFVNWLIVIFLNWLLVGVLSLALSRVFF